MLSLSIQNDVKRGMFRRSHTSYKLFILFSISEPAPVRLASLRAERAYNHWEGASHLIEARMVSREDFEGNRGNMNKISTRSKFKKGNFFI